MIHCGMTVKKMGVFRNECEEDESIDGEGGDSNIVWYGQIESHMHCALIV